MSSSNSEDSCDEELQSRLLQQLDQFVCEKLGDRTTSSLPVATKRNKKKKISKFKTENDAVQDAKFSSQINLSNTKKQKLKYSNESIDDHCNMPAVNNAASDISTKTDKKSTSREKSKKKKKNTVQQNERESQSASERQQHVKSTSKQEQNSSQTLQPSKDELIIRDSTNVESEGSEADDVRDFGEDDDAGDFDDEDDVSDLGADDGASDFDNDNMCGFDSDIEENKKSKKGAKHLEDIKRTVGLTEKDFLAYKAKQKRDNTNHIVPNKFGVKKRPPPEIVVFTDYKKKKREEAALREEEEGMQLSKAKWDVRRFGTAALKTQDKQASTVDMLVRLGAKRPKAKPVNYKLTQERLKQQKLERQKKLLERQQYGDTGDVIGEKLTKKKRIRKKMDKNAVRGSFGTIGKEKRGTQVISQKDIRKISRRKR